MRNSEKAMRDAAFNLRALLEQRELIDHAARLLGKSRSRSDFMLEAACERAKELDEHYGFQESPVHPMTLMLGLNTVKS